ncbi:MAG: tetratricopeptide repeat protein [Chromatiales bacterium]|nr:tetratricopeptide repeat protein [Chromatiales bacterium]
MSVINQMLVDLESRRKVQLPDASLKLVRESHGTPSQQRRQLVPLLLTLVALLLAALAYTLWQQQPAAMATATPAAVAEPEPAISVTEAPPATLTAPVEAAPLATTPSSEVTAVAPATPPEPAPVEKAVVTPLSDNIETQATAKTVAPKQTVQEKRRRTESAATVVTRPRDAVGKVILPPNKSEQAEQHYRDGYQAIQRRNNSAAEKLWREALQLSAQHTAAREGLVALYLSQGRKVEARNLLREGHQLLPDNERFTLLYSRLQAEAGETSAAIETLQTALHSPSVTQDTLTLAAALHQQRNEFVESITYYQQALKQQPQNATGWMGLAISLEGNGEADRALNAYKEALQRGGLSSGSKAYVLSRVNALE